MNQTTSKSQENPDFLLPIDNAKIFSSLQNLSVILDRHTNNGLALRNYYHSLISNVMKHLPLNTERIDDLVRMNIETARRNIRESFILASSSEILAVGSRRVVIDVGNGLIAKLPLLGRKEPFITISTDTPYKFCEISNSNILRKLGMPALDYVEAGMSFKTKTLKEFRGRSIDMFIEFNVQFKDGVKEESVLQQPRKAVFYAGSNISITHNLRSLGYQVQGLHEESFNGLVNEEQLHKDYQSLYDALLNMHQSNHPQYALEVLAHTPESSTPPSEAINHMFFILKKDNCGKLVIGDIDHVNIYSKPA